MRVAFVTPLEERSAIADVSLRVVEAVSRRWDVDLWYPACDRPRFTTLRTFPFARGESAAAALQCYDLVIYALGDSPFHLEILAVARRVPGLVVMHDQSLVHLVAGFSHRIGVDLLEAAALESGSAEVYHRLAETRRLPRGSITELFDVLPMTGFALQRSLGVVTHSHAAAEQFRSLTLGSVSVARLPALHAPATTTTTTPRPRDGDSEFILVVAGVVNRNKCVDRLLRVIASSGLLRQRIRLRVIGEVSIENRAELEKLADDLGVAECFTLIGSLAAAEFQAALDAAHGFACLRDPVMEAASASLLDEMSTGRPVIVYDHGHYAEMPDDAVVKVPLEDDHAGLTRALESLVSAPATSRETGWRGRQYVLEHHTPEAYAEVLDVAGQAALSTRPLVEGLGRTGRDLRALGLAEDPYARAGTARAFAELFGTPVG